MQHWNPDERKLNPARKALLFEQLPWLNYEQWENELIASENIEISETPEREFLFRELLSILSEEAKEVTELIFNTPTELIEIALETGRGITRHAIFKYLRHQGWVVPAIKNAFNEIRLGLRELDGGKENKIISTSEQAKEIEEARANLKEQIQMAQGIQYKRRR